MSRSQYIVFGFRVGYVARVLSFSDFARIFDFRLTLGFIVRNGRVIFVRGDVIFVRGDFACFPIQANFSSSRGCFVFEKIQILFEVKGVLLTYKYAVQT